MQTANVPIFVAFCIIFEMTTESYITRVIIILILKHIISHHFHRARVLNKMQFKNRILFNFFFLHF